VAELSSTFLKYNIPLPELAAVALGDIDISPAESIRNLSLNLLEA
jgi:hypothetical protein